MVPYLRTYFWVTNPYKYHEFYSVFVGSDLVFKKARNKTFSKRFIYQRFLSKVIRKGRKYEQTTFLDFFEGRDNKCALFLRIRQMDNIRIVLNGNKMIVKNRLYIPNRSSANTKHYNWTQTMNFKCSNNVSFYAELRIWIRFLN